MIEPRASQPTSSGLRARAERLADTGPTPENEWASQDDAARTMHELRVHQIELEMQNEELRRAHADLEASRRRYQDLYELAPVGYLTMDGDGRITETNLTATSQLGVTRESVLGKPFSSFVLPSESDLFHKFCRRRMQEDDAGPYSCELRIRGSDHEPRWVHIEATKAREGQDAPMIRLVLSDIDRRIAAEARLEQEAEMLRRSEARLEEMLKQRERDLDVISSTLSSVIDVMGQVVETRDPYTAGHQRRVAELATAIAADMGMPESRVEEIRIAALIHDVGKMSIPSEILSKPGALSMAEFDLIKTHSEAGSRIIDSAHLNGHVARIVYEHHERCDGSGYPRGVSGEDLLPESKVLMVADVVEAMMSHRPYRAGLGLPAALAEIAEGAGGRFDAIVSASCSRVFVLNGFSFSDGGAL